LANTALSDHRQRHAVRTLALLTGRHFHREPDKVENAKKWLKCPGR
jgi:hypothetical protein